MRLRELFFRLLLVTQILHSAECEQQHFRFQKNTNFNYPSHSSLKLPNTNWWQPEEVNVREWVYVAVLIACSKKLIIIMDSNERRHTDTDANVTEAIKNSVLFSILRKRKLNMSRC